MGEFILRGLGGLVLWLFLYPITWLVSAPFILVFAAFKPGPYGASVVAGFQRATSFWSKWGSSPL
jgi:hypothetical protein